MNMRTRTAAWTWSAAAALVVSCTDANLPPFAIAYFKTPTLRDLGHSGPTCTTASSPQLSDVIRHYRDSSDLARGSQLRNGSDQLTGIRLSG